MNEIAEATFYEDDFKEIFGAIWKNLAPTQKNWRVMFKAISLLEYVLKNGVATCVDETRDQIYYLRNLENFSVTDEGKERGQGVRDKVQQIMGMVTDDNTMQLERQKARQLKKKFSTSKSVGSAPAPAQPASSATSSMKNFFGSKSAPKAPAGPSYVVKSGKLDDIPSGTVMKPTTGAAPAGEKKNPLAFIGKTMEGVVSAATNAVSHATSSTPVERKLTPLRNFRDLPDAEMPEPEPEPEPEPVIERPAAKPTKPKVTRANKEAQALFNFSNTPTVTLTPTEEVEAPQPAQPAQSVQPIQSAQPDFFAPAAPKPQASAGASLFAPAPAKEPTKAAPAPAKEEFDFLNDLDSMDLKPTAPAAPVSNPGNAFDGLMNFGPSQPQYQQPQQQPQSQSQYPQQMMQQMFQQMTPQQRQMYQQMAPQQQQMYQQQYYRQCMAYAQQQQMYQQQRGGYNMGMQQGYGF